MTFDVEYVRSRLAYDAEAGTLTWKACENMAPHWNDRFAGKPAFTAMTSQGYPHGSIKGRHFTAHRIAWAIHHGEWPKHQIDHINGIRSDYRAVNLRDVPEVENRRNMAKPKTNTSGIVGISRKSAKSWCAYIGSRSTFQYLGSFQCLGQAIKARATAASEFGMHPNHGRAA